MSKRSIIISSFILLGSLFSAKAQESDLITRAIISSYALEIGGESALSTYLSPIKYHGTRVGLSGIWQKRLSQNTEKLAMRFSADVAVASMTPKGNTQNMTDAGLDFDWTLKYKVAGERNWSVRLGAGSGLTAGLLYKPSNSNNPVAAYTDLHLSLAVSGTWNIKLGRLPITISDDVSLPSLSIFFSPEYAEPYYVIYLGARNGLCNAGWWGNHFAIDNLLNCRLGFGSRALDFGYRFKVNSSWAHHINTQRASHSFILGVTLGPSSHKIIKECL